MSPPREQTLQDRLKEVFSSRSLSSYFFRYSFVFLAVLATVLLKWEIRALNEGSPSLLFIFPVVLSTFIGGFGAGVIATIFAAICSIYLFMPYQMPYASESIRIIQTVAFILEGVVASGLIEMTVRNKEHEFRIRQWYEVTLSSIGDAVIATDNEGYVLYMNPVAEKLTGWKLSKAIDKPLPKIFNVIDENTGRRADNPVDMIIQGNQTAGFTGPTVLLSKKGTEISIDDSAAPIRNAKGDTIGVILVFHDVTETRKTQEALRLSEERLRLALRHTNIMAWGKDRKHRYIWLQNVNSKKYRQEDIIGKTDRQINAMTPENIIKHEAAERDVLKSRKTRTVEINFGTQERPAHYEIIIQPVTDVRGNIIGVSGTAIDVTRHKLVDEKKDEFMSIASHELRTPLTSIKGYVQILERIIRELGNEKARLYINRTQTYVDRLGSLISDLLDVSKIQAGKLQLNLERFDLNELIDQSVENAQMMTDTHTITKKSTVHLMLIGDKNRLEQVLNNLLSNAVKYSPQADKVVVDVKKEKDRVTVSVRDFGIGIPAANQPHLFGRFYRVEQSAHRFSGLGIGLYISNEIIKRHGGEMRVESTEGRGSRFSFSVPLLPNGSGNRIPT